MRMVFHHPHALALEGARASAIRPVQMVRAFEALGWQVDLVTGSAACRAESIAAIESRSAAGQRYDFVYAESSTEPTLLTDPHHLPLHPRLDFSFFARMKRRRVPIGLFYRDVYWRFPGYGQSLPTWKRVGAHAMYRYDLWQYRRCLDIMYLPTLEMAAHVPWPLAKAEALPPGCHSQPAPPKREDEGLSLLYVGGLSSHYQLHAVCRAVASVPGVSLTICTRPEEWAHAKESYPWVTEGCGIKVCHAQGEALRALYAQADLSVLCVEPSVYWTFAAPVKLFEYLGMGRPILASLGTWPGSQVAKEGWGWTVPYDDQAIADCLRHLLTRPDDFERARQRVLAQAGRHTWEARARQVADGLMGGVARSGEGQ